LIHIHALFSYPSTISAHLASRYRVPYIVRPLGTLQKWSMKNRRPLLKQLSFLAIEKRALAGAAAVHYTSEWERQEAEEAGAVGPGVVVPLALESGASEVPREPDHFYKCYPHLKGRSIILFLSRIDQKK